MKRKILTGLALLALLAGALAQTTVHISGATLSARTPYATNSLVASTLGRKLYTVVGANIGGSDMYVCVFDTNAVPANSTGLPFVPILVTAGQPFSIDYPGGLNMTNGIVVAISTSRTAFTIAGNSLRAEVTFYDYPH